MSYDVTKSRVLQWIGIIAILCLFGGAYWYFQVYGSTLNSPQNDSLMSGLVGLWSFNGDDLSGTTAYDRSGNGNNGTLTGGPTATQGKVGQALSFDGADDYVRLGDSADVRLAQNESITLSAWVKTSLSSGVQQNIIRYDDSDTVDGDNTSPRNLYLFRISTTNKVNAVYGPSAGLSVIDSNQTIAANQWYHVVFVRDVVADTEAIFINGSLDISETDTTTGTWETTGQYPLIGKFSSNEYFNGLIDEVRIYNRALGATEIQSLYALGQSDKVNSSVSQSQGTGRLDSGLAGYWKLDENTGTSAGDSSTNGNTGTLTNGPTWTAGQIGSAVTLDGTDDYIQVANASSLQFANTSGITLSAWVKPAQNTAYGTILIKGRDTDGNEANYALRQDSSGKKLEFYYNESGNTNFHVWTTTDDIFSTTGVWYHVMVTYTFGTGSSIKAYVNGVSRGGSWIAGSGNVAPDVSTQVLLIGKITAGERFSGSLDEVRIYNSALSADEVSQLYRLTTPTGTDTGLKGYWSFNGQDISGTTAYDRSGSGNNGTLTNSPTKVPGKLGQGLNFDGTDDYVNIPHSTVLNVGGTLSSYSVSVWFKTTQTARVDVINKYDATAADGTSPLPFLLDINAISAGQVRFYYRGTGGAGDSSSLLSNGLTYNDGNWHHAVVTIDRGANTATLALDGVSKSQSIGVSTSMSNSFAINIGALDNDGSFLYGRSSIDEARLYNRALSAAEIKSLYDVSQSDKVNSSVSQPQGTGRLDSGLAGYWKLDENTGTSAGDSSTNGNTGTLTNGPTWATGQIGSAVTFDGTDDYVSIPSSSAHNFSSSQNFTVSTWIKVPATQTNTVTTTNEVIQKWDNSAHGYPFVIRLHNQTSGNAGKIVAARYDGTNNPGILSTTTINDNAWHLILFTKQGATLSLYIDGILQGTTTDTTTGTTTNSDVLSFGVRAGVTPVYYLTGSLDEVRIYNRTLSPDEVSQLYRLTTPTGVDTGLKGYWSFNGKDMSGTTAYDRSGAGNTGTLTNGPTKVPGKLGQALSFDGTDDYVTAGTTGVPTGASLITISYWQNQLSNTSQMAAVSLEPSSGKSFTITPIYLAGTYYIWTDSVVENFTVTAGQHPPLNQWCHVVINYDGTNLNYYLNGVFQASHTYAVNTATLNSVEIARRIAGATGNFPGKIDEVRIYNRVLSADEIKALYNSSR